MTVPANYPIMTVQGDGASTVILTNITIREKSDLLIIVINNETRERRKLDGLGVAYDISTLDTGATITLKANNVKNKGQNQAGGYIEVGYRLEIRRVVKIDQQTSIKNQGAFYPEIHEDEFDKQIHIDQQQQHDLDSSIKIVDSDGTAGGGTVESSPDTVIGFDSTGNLETKEVGTGGSIIDEDRLQSEIDNIEGKNVESQLYKDGKTLTQLKGELDDILEDLGDIDSETSNANGDVFERLNALKEAIGTYLDKPQDDAGGSLHARINAERTSRLDAVRGIEVGTNQYKGRGLRQLSDLVDVNRGKIAKDLEKLDLPKQGNTKDHSLGETIFNHSEDTTSTIVNSNEDSYTIPLIETSSESNVDYPTSKTRVLGDDRANFSTPDRFKMYELTSPFQGPSGAGNIRVWSIFSGSVRNVSNLMLPERIGSITVAESERRFDTSFGSFDSAYWEGASGRDVLDVTIEGRKVPASLSFVVLEPADTPILVYLSVADSTFDSLDIERFDDSTDNFVDADLVGLTRSLTMVPRLQVDGQDVSGFAFFGEIAAGKDKNAFWGAIHDQSGSTRTAEESVFFSLRSPRPAEGLLKFNVLSQGRNTISVGAVTKKASIPELKKVFAGSGGGGTITKTLNVNRIVTSNRFIDTPFTEAERDLIRNADALRFGFTKTLAGTTAQVINLPRSTFGAIISNENFGFTDIVLGPGGSVVVQFQKVATNGVRIRSITLLRADGSYSNTAINSTFPYMTFFEVINEVYTLS